MSLQAYYKLDSGWDDHSGNGYDGSPTGAIINNVNQKLGAGCGEFDGLNDKVTFASFFDYSNLSALSIDGFVNHTAMVNADGIWGGVGDGNCFIISLTNGMQFAIGSGFARIATGFTAETYSYFAVVFDGSQSSDETRARIYIDGSWKTLTFTGDPIPATTPSNLPLPELGDVAGLSRPWYGFHDDIAIYDHVLDQDWVDGRWDNGDGREISMVNGLARLGRGLNRGLGRGL